MTSDGQCTWQAPITMVLVHKGTITLLQGLVTRGWQPSGGTRHPRETMGGLEGHARACRKQASARVQSACASPRCLVVMHCGGHQPAASFVKPVWVPTMVMLRSLRRWFSSIASMLATPRSFTGSRGSNMTVSSSLQVAGDGAWGQQHQAQHLQQLTQLSNSCWWTSRNGVDDPFQIECTASAGNNWSGGHALAHSIALVLTTQQPAACRPCSAAALLALRCSVISLRLHARQQQAADMQT